MTQDSAPHDSGFGMVPNYLRGRLTANEIAVFVALTWRANEYGRCWPSMTTLAADAGMSESSARRTLARLRDQGLVTWVARESEYGDRASNLYTVHIYRNPDGVVSQGQGGGVSLTGEPEPRNQTQSSDSLRSSGAVGAERDPIGAALSRRGVDPNTLDESEDTTVEGMLSGGSHPKAIANAIAKRRCAA